MAARRQFWHRVPLASRPRNRHCRLPWVRRLHPLAARSPLALWPCIVDLSSLFRHYSLPSEETVEPSPVFTVLRVRPVHAPAVHAVPRVGLAGPAHYRVGVVQAALGLVVLWPASPGRAGYPDTSALSRPSLPLLPPGTSGSPQASATGRYGRCGRCAGLTPASLSCRTAPHSPCSNRRARS